MGETCDICGRTYCASEYGIGSPSCYRLGYEREKAALERLEAELARAQQTICDFQAAGMIDVGGMGGPCEVKPAHIEKHVTELRARAIALEKALREARRWLPAYRDDLRAKIDAALAGAPGGEKEVGVLRDDAWAAEQDKLSELDREIRRHAGYYERDWCAHGKGWSLPCDACPRPAFDAQPAPAAGGDEAVALCDAVLLQLNVFTKADALRILRAALAAAERRGLERAAEIGRGAWREHVVEENGKSSSSAIMSAIDEAIYHATYIAEQPAPEPGEGT